MNHTQRVFEVARQVRGLTRDHARQAVELYLASIAEEAARGEIVSLPSIGRLNLVCRKNGGKLKSRVSRAEIADTDPGYRVQTCIHLSDALKASAKKYLLPAAKLDDHIQRNTVSIRVEPGEGNANRIQSGLSNLFTRKDKKGR